LLSEEIAIIEIYLELQKLRVEEKLDYAITLSTTIYEDVRIPFMIIQPFVENPIKHGISTEESKKGSIRINVNRVGNRIVCEIADNGVGINSTQRINDKSAHISMVVISPNEG
jgi:sensor histidine kinase YesM